ncbi:amidohydrolase family protein [Actinoplanes sp. NPDC089786]|uniref:amidohydrolase family protein n=1 Tax=Actinoplanes sp. NPDC089786 TaxID=3155185 RepID=UPI00342E0349
MDHLADVAVVDPRDGSITPHQDIHFSAGRIASIGSTASPGGGRTRFVVPGFVDMHAHPLNLADPTPALRLMLSFGITGYRQMSGTPALLRNRPAADSRSPGLLATPGSVLTPINAGTPAQAAAEVRRQAAAGADFIKVAVATPVVYAAIQAEADRAGLPVVGHLPTGIDVREARYRSIEHLGPGLGLLAGCSDHEDHLRTATAGAPLKAPPFPIPFAGRIAEILIRRIVLNPTQLTTPAMLDSTREAIDTFTEDKARALARHFAATETWNCPTLIRVKAQQLCADPVFPSDPDLRYATAKERKAWTAAAKAFRRKFDESQRAVFAEQFALQLRMVKILDEEGAPLLAGTDAVGAAWVVPGASLHDEFDLLSEAGLTPLRILQTATVDPARFLHREDVSGTVDPGKEADLVLLSADPTAAATNLHQLIGVIRAGRHYSTDDLNPLRNSNTAAA